MLIFKFILSLLSICVNTLTRFVGGGRFYNSSSLTMKQISSLISNYHHTQKEIAMLNFFNQNFNSLPVRTIWLSLIVIIPWFLFVLVGVLINIGIPQKFKWWSNEKSQSIFYIFSYIVFPTSLFLFSFLYSKKNKFQSGICSALLYICMFATWELWFYRKTFIPMKLFGLLKGYFVEKKGAKK